MFALFLWAFFCVLLQPTPITRKMFALLVKVCLYTKYGDQRCVDVGGKRSLLTHAERCFSHHSGGDFHQAKNPSRLVSAPSLGRCCPVGQRWSCWTGDWLLGHLGLCSFQSHVFTLKMIESHTFLCKILAPSKFVVFDTNRAPRCIGNFRCSMLRLGGKHNEFMLIDCSHMLQTGLSPKYSDVSTRY